MKSLARCENLFGPISPDIQKRIRTYIANPTVDGWEDISHIIIASARLITIWKAILALDNTFPIHGRFTDAEGNILKEWERIPSPMEVLRAIKAATS